MSFWMSRSLANTSKKNIIGKNKFEASKWNEKIITIRKTWRKDWERLKLYNQLLSNNNIQRISFSDETIFYWELNHVDNDIYSYSLTLNTRIYIEIRYFLWSAVTITIRSVPYFSQFKCLCLLITNFTIPNHISLNQEIRYTWVQNTSEITCSFNKLTRSHNKILISYRPFY